MDAEKIARLYEDMVGSHECFHSQYQIDRYIVAKNGLTPFGMHRQAVREMESRVGTLLNDLTSEKQWRRKARGKRVRAWFVPVLTFGLRMRKQVHLSEAVRYERMADICRRTFADRFREFRRFFAIAAALKPVVDRLTPEDRALAEADHRQTRVRLQALIDIRQHGEIRSAWIFETVPFLPEAFQLEIWNAAQDGGEQLEQWFQWYCTTGLARLENTLDAATRIEQAWSGNPVELVKRLSDVSTTASHSLEHHGIEIDETRSVLAPRTQGREHTPVHRVFE